MEEKIKSRKACMMCLHFLSFCLNIGWDKKDIPALEELWWRGHDWQTGEVDLSNF